VNLSNIDSVCFQFQVFRVTTNADLSAPSPKRLLNLLIRKIHSIVFASVITFIKLARSAIPSARSAISQATRSITFNKLARSAIPSARSAISQATRSITFNKLARSAIPSKPDRQSQKLDRLPPKLPDRQSPQPDRQSRKQPDQ
jgi:hypothetical protein